MLTWMLNALLDGDAAILKQLDPNSELYDKYITNLSLSDEDHKIRPATSLQKTPSTRNSSLVSLGMSKTTSSKVLRPTNY